MLALRCVAPVFALVGGVTVWAMAGPMAAALALVIFILGVATSEMHHLRWSRVDDAALTADDLAIVALAGGAAGLELAEPIAAMEPELQPEPAPEPELALLVPPKRDFQCTRQELAIGSGRSRVTLGERRRRLAGRPARRRADPAPVAAPPPVAAVQTVAPPAASPAPPAVLVVAAAPPAANDMPEPSAGRVEPASFGTDRAAAAGVAAPAPTGETPPEPARPAPAEPARPSDPRTMKFRASYEARLSA